VREREREREREKREIEIFDLEWDKSQVFVVYLPF